MPQRESQTQVPERLTWPTHPGCTNLHSFSEALARVPLQKKAWGKLHVEVLWEQYLWPELGMGAQNKQASQWKEA